MIKIKKKGKLCGLFLVLLIMFGLSLSVFSINTSALKHQYVSIPLYVPPKPEIQLNNDTGKYELTGKIVGAGSDSNFEDFGSYFFVDYLPSNITQSLRDSEVLSTSSSNIFTFFNSYTNNNNCEYFPTYGGSYQPIFTLNDFNTYVTINSSPSFQRIPNGDYFNSYFNGNYDFRCQRLKAFGDSIPSFDSATMPMDYANQYQNILQPYSYAADGFYTTSHAVKNGVHYDEYFNFAKVFGSGNNLNKFSALNIPLFDENQSIDFNYGRSVEFTGSFSFEEPFTISQTAADSGHFYIDFNGIADDGGTYNHQISCTLNMRTVPDINYYGLEYSCPWTVDKNYIYTNYSFYIDAEPSSDPSSWSYVWDSTGRWTWAGQTGAGQYIITDNDDTPGDPINSSRTGNYIPNDAERIANSSNSNDIIIDGANFSQSLIKLFGFSFLNPFAPLLQMFSDNNSCASIPTIAGMIHSESTQVCPWFDSTTRNIATPVLSIASMMLIFGFAVRWLGARSGNFIDDSDSHDVGAIKIGRRGRT